MVSVRIPEAQRKLRHHLQTQLEWTGLGSPAPGEWLTPHVSRQEEVLRIVKDLELDDLAHSLVGRYGPVGAEDRMVHRAWDLDALAADYREFIDRFQIPSPRSDRDALIERLQLVQAWRRFPYLDPDLPAQFLPRDWVGDRAAAPFEKHHAALAVRAWRRWEQLSEVNEH